MILSISPKAVLDMESIGDYIAQDNPVRAVSFIDELYAQCRIINEQPQGYQKRPELGDNVRLCAYGRYVIFFTSSEKEVRIERVLHGARAIKSLWDASDGDRD